MNKFEQKYLEILNKIQDFSLIGKDNCNGIFTQLSPLKLENLYFEAIDQNQFSELAPVPKPLLNFICSKVKTKNNNQFIISYNEIFQLLKNYQYKDAYDFKQALKLLKVYDSGFLTIGICDYEFQEFINLFKNEYMSIQRLQSFFNICNNDHSGDTFSGDPILKAKFKNACIWLNKEWIIKNSTWKDTLSHELTHFIHRVVILQRTTYTGKIQRNIIYNNDSFENVLSFDQSVNNTFNAIFSKRITNKVALEYLKSLFKGTLYNRQQSTSIQNILNGFQRMYQQQHFIGDKISYKNIQVNHNAKQYQRQRLEFLNKLLKQINDVTFFNTVKGQCILNFLLGFNNQKIKSSYRDQKEFKESILILHYLGIKYLIPEWKINQKLDKHFRIFKFRDN